MPASPEQWEEIQALRAQHDRELSDFDSDCRTKRIEMEQAHDREFDDLYKRFGARRGRSTPEAMANGRVRK
jgi:hypothetical protein